MAAAALHPLVACQCVPRARPRRHKSAPAGCDPHSECRAWPCPPLRPSLRCDRPRAAAAPTCLRLDSRAMQPLGRARCHRARDHDVRSALARSSHNPRLLRAAAADLRARPAAGRVVWLVPANARRARAPRHSGPQAAALPIHAWRRRLGQVVFCPQLAARARGRRASVPPPGVRGRLCQARVEQAHCPPQPRVRPAAQQQRSLRGDVAGDGTGAPLLV